MSLWNDVPFSELLIESRDGEWGVGESSVGHTLCEVIRGTDFSNINAPDVELPQRWIKDHLVERKRLQVGDVLLETAGGTATQSTGRSTLLRKRFFELHSDMPVLCASFARHLRLKDKYSPEFIYYLLQALYDAGFMAVYNLQHTGVSRFQYTAFKNKTVLKIPLLNEQRKIASILAAYDDLIENNKRRITLLEKMAEEIYREWFVRFRFPGYQTAEFEKGIPKGWSRRPVNSILDFKSGYAFKSGTYVTGGKYGIVTIKNVHDGRFVKECTDNIDALPPRLPKHCQIKDGDILMSLTGNVGRVCIAEGENLLLNQRVAILQPKVETHSHFIYWLFRQDSLHTLSELISTGAAQQNLSPVKLGNQLILYPDREILEEYQVKADPIMKLVLRLRKQVSILEATKSTLLPRLISGKLQVEDIDIEFPPSMSENEAA